MINKFYNRASPDRKQFEETSHPPRNKRKVLYYHLDFICIEILGFPICEIKTLELNRTIILYLNRYLTFKKENEAGQDEIPMLAF